MVPGSPKQTHEIFGNATKAHTIPVPRHKEINERTAAAILAAAGR